MKSQDTLTGERNAEPIVGATIKAEESTGRILIARVMHGGAADRSGLIAVGDEVGDDVGVNDTPVFLLNEYIVELDPANFNILNQILN